jgi:hypothetical protein
MPPWTTVDKWIPSEAELRFLAALDAGHCLFQMGESG